jgi:hypothetical protein
MNQSGRYLAMPDTVTVERWNPYCRQTKVGLADLPEVLATVPEDTSMGLALDDGADDCVIVTVEPEFSTVTMLRDRTFYYLRISDDSEEETILVAGEEITWPKGCLLPRPMGTQVLLEAGDRETVWDRYSWVEQ